MVANILLRAVGVRLPYGPGMRLAIANSVPANFRRAGMARVDAIMSELPLAMIRAWHRR